MKHCPLCAEEIQDAAVKCKHCGSMLCDYIENNVSNIGNKNKQLHEIKKFKVIRKNVTCLECGYIGMMGQTKEKFPVFLGWWILVPIIFISMVYPKFRESGITSIVVFLICRVAFSKIYVLCPSCCKEIGPIK